MLALHDSRPRRDCGALLSQKLRDLGPKMSHLLLPNADKKHGARLADGGNHEERSADAAVASPKSPRPTRSVKARCGSTSPIHHGLATWSAALAARACSPKRTDKLHVAPPREVAGELTLMDAEILRRIDTAELENGAWMDKERKHELAPNVLAMVASFNRLALLVPTEILREKTPQARSRVISIFIQLASKCHSLHNFNSLKAVLAGLQCTPIYRLTKTWKEVPSKRRKKFQRLSRLMSEEDNWQLYRRELDLLAAAGTPFIPFLGNFLTQVVQTQSFESLKQKRTQLRRRSSVFETYTILEPITARNWLERSAEDGHGRPMRAPLSPNDSPSEFGSEERRGRTRGVDDVPLSFSDVDFSLGICEISEGEEVMSPGKVTSPIAGVSPREEASLSEAVEMAFDSSGSFCDTISSSPVTVEIECERERPSTLAISELSNGACSMIDHSSGSLLSPDRCGRLGDSMPSSEDELDIGLSDEDSRSETKLPDAPVVSTSLRRRSVSADCLIDAPWDKSMATKKSASLERHLDVDLTTSRCTGNDSGFFDRSSTKIGLRGHSSNPEYPGVRDHTFESLPVSLAVSGHHISSAVLSSRRRRHTAGSVAKISQDSSSAAGSLSPFELLQRYQLISIGCCNGLVSKVTLRTFLDGCTHNTEGQNFQLSYSEEP